MIFITLHDNSENISNEKDIILCLAGFDYENINSLFKITFSINSNTYSVIFYNVTSLGNTSVNYLGGDINNFCNEFYKASKFEVIRKDGFYPKREFLVNDYNEIDKIMLIGGKWIKQ